MLAAGRMLVDMSHLRNIQGGKKKLVNYGNSIKCGQGMMLADTSNLIYHRDKKTWFIYWNNKFE